MKEIVAQVASRAWERPLLSSGLWFHQDIRDNFYYASYLFAASVDSGHNVPFKDEQGRSLAEQVMLRVLDLQNTDENSSLYGYWPLKLDPDPEVAAPHKLPIELMGSLLSFFYQTYRNSMSDPLERRMYDALVHVYKSDYYRKPLEDYHHHEAKYTAAKLILGDQFNDADLIQDGRQCLNRLKRKIESEGMAEYGCLPWFWHWVQAFTCAWKLTKDELIREELAGMLDLLWSIRAAYYLKGAWVGAHSRGLKHDVPRDANVLHDYVQFGDFTLPEQSPRPEYAGLLFYQAPRSAHEMALHSSFPREQCKSIVKTVDNDIRTLHSYVYFTDQFAAGGMWERVLEFDNEQVRWMYSLPVREGHKGNQLFFFHPGERYSSEKDPRHQSEWTEVLYFKNIVMAFYPLPEDVPDQVIGVVPEGEWSFDNPHALFGKVEETYFAIFLNTTYETRVEEGYSAVICSGRNTGVVVEAVTVNEAKARGIEGLDDFIATMSARSPVFSAEPELQSRYKGLLTDEVLSLEVSQLGESAAKINGAAVSYENYTIA